MAFYPSHDLPGGQAITESSATQKHPLGTRIRAVDPVYGEGEFIYLKGVASTVAGSAVSYNQVSGATTLSVAASKGPVAIAMSANVANQYGWYLVAGACSVKVAAAVVSGAAVYTTATGGALDDAVVAGSRIGGAAFISADSGGFADVQVNHAHFAADA